jgi:hypothetical protein
MKMNQLQGYKDIWPENKYESIESILNGIPSILVIGVLASLNSRLYIEGHSIETQNKLLNEIFLRRQSMVTVKDVTSRLNKHISSFNNQNLLDEKAYSLFSERSILRFIEYEILNFRESPENFIDTNPSQELRIFRAVLFFNDLTNEEIKYPLIEKGIEQREFFYRTWWPIMAKQYHVQFRQNYFYQMIKGIVLMSEIKKSEYGQCVDLFLSKNGRKSIHDYLFDIVKLIEYCDQGKNKGSFSRTGFTINTESLDFVPTFYGNNCVNIESFKDDSRYNIEFTGLKSKPLIKFKDNQFLVSSWVFLQNKLYEGLIFDFVNTINKPELTYGKFKSKFSDLIIEKIVFKNVMKYILDTKFSILHFDNGQKEPDCYFRKGNWVLISEFKDVSFASEAIAKSSYEGIKEEIERKICSDKIGVYQLIEQIKILAKSNARYDSEFPQANKLTIQPLLIVTDKIFEMPGVNQFVNTLFRNEVKNISNEFRNISDVVIVNFDFFFNNLNQFKDKKIDLKYELERYINYIRGREKQLKHQRLRAKDFEKLFISFESYFYEQNNVPKHAKYIKTLFEIFDLKYGLPK